MNIIERKKLAIQKYMEVMNDETLGPVTQFTPPISNLWGDKAWAKVLRETWPDHKTIYLPVKPSYEKSVEIKKWLSETTGRYWYNTGQDAYYFEESSSALAFAITFNGVTK
ncbi:hypothetical protein FDI40_gp255 [Agrobacterium phage Atu_ph07]|uniref:Uncharacterized protein n=1 Tax=Agrobacterium phage Atu_ph07 TaxID=2024264 RepID=A0A2L0UZR6_9CAUD|nr:hypothetical protein FDI40_gp255 [Agrobacterium phage Atu_ph07]AUZ95034.1 hypothetical protein [Agrobacterium phage Atu_ph07]